MGRILTRYIFTEILTPFVFGLAVFTSILLIARVLKLVEMVVNRGVPFLDILKLFSLILPAFLEVTIPMALLLAILLAFGRLSSDSEIVAMKTSGLSLYQLVIPVALFTGLVFLLTLWTALYVRPWSHQALRAQLFEIARTRAAAGFKEKVFNDEFPGIVLYVEEIEPGGNTLKGILISDTRNPENRNTVLAKVGLLVPNEESPGVTLRLLDGTIYGSVNGQTSFQQTDFNVYDVHLSLPGLGDEKTRSLRPEEMTLAQLRSVIAQKTARGASAQAERLELQRKVSIPFACLVFALVGVPLGIQPSRAVRSRGFSISLLMIFGYYVLLTVGQALAEKEQLPPLVALWTPNVTFLALGLYLFSRAARESPVLPLDPVVSSWRRLRERFPSHA